MRKSSLEIPVVPLSVEAHAREHIEYIEDENFDVTKSPFFYANGNNLIEKLLNASDEKKRKKIESGIINLIDNNFKLFLEENDAQDWGIFNKFSSKISEYTKNLSYVDTQEQEETLQAINDKLNGSIDYMKNKLEELEATGGINTESTPAEAPSHTKRNKNKPSIILSDISQLPEVKTSGKPAQLVRERDEAQESENKEPESIEEFFVWLSNKNNSSDKELTTKAPIILENIYKKHIEELKLITDQNEKNKGCLKLIGILRVQEEKGMFTNISNDIKEKIISFKKILIEISDFKTKKPETSKPEKRPSEPAVESIEDVASTENKTKKETTPEVEAEIEAETEPIDTPRERNIDDIIIHDNDPLKEIPENIKKDEGFNTWIEAIYKQGITDKKHTLEDWYKTYNEQKVQLDKMREIILDKKMDEVLFGGFIEGEERDFAKVEYIKEIQFKLITDYEKTSKILNLIIENHKKAKDGEAKYKKLESDKKELEAALSDKSKKLPADVLFNVLHKEAAETEKINDFGGFITDMSHNYKTYIGSIKSSEKVGALRKMFGRYKNTRDKTTTHMEGRMGIAQRTMGWFKNLVDYAYPKHEDMSLFGDSVSILQESKLVETREVSKDDAEKNMAKLANFIIAVKRVLRTEEKLSIEEATNKIKETLPEGKILFDKIYPTYIKNRANNSTLQKKAEDEGTKAINNRDVELILMKKDVRESEKEKLKDLIGETEGFEEFKASVKASFVNEKLDTIEDTFKKANKANPITLEKLRSISKEIDNLSIPTDANDEISLLHKKVSLQISQEYLKLISQPNSKIELLAPESRNHYKIIFENDNASIKKEDKKKYADAILLELKKMVDLKSSVKRTFLQKLEINRLIKYFEEKSK